MILSLYVPLFFILLEFMSSRSTAAVLVACGAIGLAAYWWSRRRRRLAEQPAAPAADDFKQTFESIILSTNMTDHPPQLNHITGQISQLIEYLSPAQIEQLKLLSDEISYAVSEWYFYHTLRTNKSINWNPETGLIDEALSPEERQLGSQLAKAIRRAFWDNHLSDLEKSPPDYSRVIERIDELNTRLVSYLKSTSPIIDTEIVQRMISEKRFSKEFFLHLIETTVLVMYDIESPAAHEDTQRWLKHVQTEWELHLGQAPTGHEIITILRFLFEQLDLVDAEIANFKTSHFPYTKRVEQEREIFRDLVDQSVLPVPRLFQLLGSLKKMSTIEETNLEVSKSVRTHVLSLLKPDPPLCLESLNLDIEAIGKLAHNRTKIVVLASFLVGVHSQVNALFPSNQAREFLSNKVAITALINQVWESSQSLSNKNGLETDLSDHLIASLLQTSFVVSNDTVLLLRRGIGQCVNENSKVRQLYERRVSELLEKGEISEISLGSSPWFLSLATAKLQELGKDLNRFVGDHLTVYLPVYRGWVGKRSLDELD